MKRHFAMPHQITCSSALPGKTGKRKSCIFPSNAVLVHCLNSTSCLISSTFLTHNSYSCCRMTPKSCINAFSHKDCWGALFKRKEVDNAAAVGLCCMHNAPVCCLLGFLFRKVMQKDWTCEMGKQSIIWFLTFSVTFLPKVIVIGSRMPRL